MRLETVGRNDAFKIRIGAITQFCSMIDKLVVKTARQRCFGFADEKNDKKYIEDFVQEKVLELPALEYWWIIQPFIGDS